MGAKLQHEVDIINKKRLHSKSKSTSVTDPIFSPPICDSIIETSTIPDLSQPIQPWKKCDRCDNLIEVNDELARDKENPLNTFCVTYFKEATKQTSVLNKLEKNTNSEMVVEGDEENK